VHAILEKLREQLQTKGSQQLGDLRKYFMQMDKQDTGIIARKGNECSGFIEIATGV